MADNLSVGIVIGAAVGSGVGRAFASVEERSRGVGDALARTNKRADRHRQELRRLRSEQARTGDESGHLARDIQRVGEKLRRTTRHARDYRGELRRVQQIQGARGAFRQTAVAGGAVLGVAYAARRLIGDAGIAHERAAAELRTVVQTDEEVGAALEHARGRVRGGAGVGETEQLQIHYELSSAGLSAEEARIGSVITEQVATATRGVLRRNGQVDRDGLQLVSGEAGGHHGREIAAGGGCPDGDTVPVSALGFGPAQRGLHGGGPRGRS